MSGNKGISLPINMLVILAISIIVLLAAVAFFMGTFSGQSGQLSDQQKVSRCCGEYVNQGGCQGDASMSNIDVDEIDENCDDIVNDPGNTCCMGAGS